MCYRLGMVYGSQLRIVGYISPSEHERLQALMEREHRKAAEIIRTAVREYLDRKDGKA